MFKLAGEYFCGNKASDYAIEQGYLDYATFSKAFDAVMNNNIMSELEARDFYFEQVGGFSADHSEELDELREELEELENGKRYTSDETGNTYIYFVDEDGERIEGEEAEKIDERIAELEEQIEELESEENDSPEIFQYFIVSSNAVDILAYNNEIVFYCEALDMYIWGVTHWGTSWDYVLTDIPLNCGEEAYASYKA